MKKPDNPTQWNAVISGSTQNYRHTHKKGERRGNCTHTHTVTHIGLVEKMFQVKMKQLDTLRRSGKPEGVFTVTLFQGVTF